MDGMKYCEFEGCSYKHPHQSKIMQHVSAVHHQIKDFNCDQCPMSFGRSFNLKRHIKIAHLKEKQFSCEQCQKNFTTKQNRDIHQQQSHKNIAIEEIVENIEIEEIVENNEFVTPSPIVIRFVNSELKNANENFVAQKSDKDLQPIVRVEKLRKAEIVLFKGGKSSQPHVFLKRLKDIEIPQNSRKKRPTTTISEKRNSETPFTTKKRDTLKLKENVPKKNSKREKKIAKEKKDFVDKYNFAASYDRSPPWTQKKTLESIILDDCTNDKKSVPKTRTLKECNIFQYLDLEYTPPIRHRDLKYTPSKYYTGKP